MYCSRTRPLASDLVLFDSPVQVPLTLDFTCPPDDW